MLLNIATGVIQCLVAGFLVAWATSLIVLKLVDEEFREGPYLVVSIALYILAFGVMKIA